MRGYIGPISVTLVGANGSSIAWEGIGSALDNEQADLEDREASALPGASAVLTEHDLRGCRCQAAVANTSHNIEMRLVKITDEFVTRVEPWSAQHDHVQTTRAGLSDAEREANVAELPDVREA